MPGVAATCTMADGRPLSALADLIGRRMKWMRESAKDAVVATAIDALVSLRALTRRARRPGRPKVMAAPGVRPSFEGGRRRPRRVLRQGGARYEAGTRVKWLVPAGAKSRDLHVFVVTPEHSAVRAYLVVAPSMERAAEFERGVAERRIRAYGGLAKWALGSAMRGLSTRNAAADVSAEAEAAGARLSSVVRLKGADGAYAVRVTDEARHAVAALRGGEGAVDVALMKAANKIAGRLAHRFGDALGSDFSAPFPEVRRRR